MAKARFRYLSHTADIEFVAYGRDAKEAIENAALALLNVALDVKKIAAARGRIETVKISEKADTIENLVWFVLQDIISKRSAEYLSAYKFEVEKLDETEGRLSLSGRLFHKKLKEDYTLLDVKAVTPHDLLVKTKKRECSITVTIDV